jgi:hypothetical protein
MRRARVAFAFPALLLLFLFTAGCGSSYNGNSSSSTCNGGGGGGCAKPTISSLLPTSAPVNSGPITLTITGTQFALGDNLQVGFNSTSLTINTLLSTSTSLVVTIPNSSLQVAGTYSVSMQDVTSGNAAYPPITFMVTPTTMVVSSIAPPDGQVGTFYLAPTINVSGGTSPYTATVTAGQLPAGLSLTPNANGSVLTISGIPTTAQTSVTFTISVTDSSPTKQTVPATYTINIAPPLLSLSPGALPPGTVGAAYNQVVSVAGGTGPYMLSVTGLPADGLNAVNGAGDLSVLISGTPSLAQTVTFSVMVTDSTSPTPQIKMANYAINIGAAPGTCYLNGRYAFQFGGGGETFVGSITVASDGSVSGGVVDHKDTFGALQSQLNDLIVAGPAGSCANGTVANTGTVSFTVNTSLNSITMDTQRVLHFALRTDDTVGFAELTIPGNSFYRKTGQIQLQDHPTNNFFGSYAFGLFGSDSASANTRYGIVGALCTDALHRVKYVHADLDDAYAVSTDTVLSNALNTVTFSAPDSNGRSAMTQWNFTNGASLNLILYVVDGNKAFVMEATDPATNPRTLIGTISGVGTSLCRPSNGAFFNNSSLTNIVNTAAVLDLGGVELVSGSPTFSSKIGVINNVNTGAGTASLTEDVDNGKTSSALSGALVTYSISTAGRGDIKYTNAQGTQDELIAYFDGAGAAYLLQEGNAMGTTNVTEVGTLQPQVLGPPFSVTSIGGTYALMAPFEAQAPLFPPTVEEVTIDNKAFTFTASGALPSAPYSVNATTGRATVTMNNGTLGSNSLIFYIVSPTKIVLTGPPTQVPQVIESLEQ